MSTFQLELDDIQAEPVELDLEPTPGDIRELFEPFEEDYRVQPERDFALELHASLDGSTVILSGRVAGTFEYTCGRCLEERDLEVTSQLECTVLSRTEWNDTYEGEDEIALEEEDLDTSYYEGDVIDLAPLVRDAVMMELPVWPQCPDEAREACDAAYEEHVGDETLEQMEHNSVDLRWWPLRDIDLDEEGDEDDEALEHDEST